ncbi:MAG: WbuC family cupin fold metalloprotein [Nanoarchaeota archaeon]
MISKQINSNDWWFDEKAKSLAYFAKTSPIKVNGALLTELKEISKENKNANIRLCLHSNSNETLHDMIILQYQDKNCRKPHMHPTNDETLHAIEGDLVAFILNDSGELKEKVILGQDNNLILRIPRNNYHVYFALKDYVIYRETTQGPFEKKKHIPPKFNYSKMLKNYVDFMDLTCNNKSCKTPCSLNIFSKK